MDRVAAVKGGAEEAAPGVPVGWLRRWVFDLVFFGGSVPIILSVPASVALGRRATIRHALLWTRYHRWAIRSILGIEVRVEGERPAGPALFAAKHQAMFETLELTRLLGGPAMVLKQELTRIPVWGWAAIAYGALAVDREGSAAALRRMVAEAQAAKAAGRSVLIFPEGTRVKPGEAPPLKSGFAGLYRMLGLPTVPVALDSGRLLPRRGGPRRGVITIRFGEAIPPGLARREVEARVHAEINALEDAE